MRILCCYTYLHPRTEWSLYHYAPKAEMVGVVWDGFRYAREIAARWDGTEDLVTVEHDIEIHEDVIAQFSRCREPWCTFPYLIMPGRLLDDGLGCARFTADAQRAVPFSELDAIPASCGRCEGKPGCWAHLDTRIAQAMAAHGVKVHVHGPPGVIHHKPSLGS
jgi:hypothetical protein